MRPALLAAAATIALAPALAGCGGSQTNGSALGGGAQYLPANTVGFVAARPDSNWRQLEQQVLHRRPPQAPKDADEIDVAVLQGGKTVVLTHAHGRWSSAAAHSPSLADAPNFRAALHAAPRDAQAAAYLRGDVTRLRLLAIPGQTGTTVANFRIRFRVVAHPLQTVSNALLRWRWGAAWLTKDGIGARAKSSGAPLAKSQRIRTVQVAAKPFTPSLLDEIPADATSVVDVLLGPSTFELMQHLPPPLLRLFPHVGFNLAADLDAVLGGETAVYTRPGGEVTVVSSPFDEHAAVVALAELSRGRTLRHAFIGGQFVVSTAARGIDAFRGGGAKLSADRAYRAAGIPAQVTALLYERGKVAAWAAPDGEDATFTARFLRASG